MNTPARRTSRLALRAGQGPNPQASRQKASMILARRDQLIGELARLRHQGSSPFIAKAQQLLTRWWSGASWAARDELIRNADWLIRLEKRHGRKVER